MSRPLIRSGQWSQTTIDVLQPADHIHSIPQKVLVTK